MARQLGIDLGSANTLFHLKGNGIILTSPTVIAVDRENGKTVAIGSDAKRMLGKTPSNIRVCCPIIDSAVADPEETAFLLHELLLRAELVSFFNRPDATISVPYGITGVERQAVENAVYEAGTKNIVLVDAPLAAAIGAGLKVLSPRGAMIVDIGCGTTEVAVITLGDIAVSRSEKIAGDDIDSAIVNYFYNRRGMQIGNMTAELVKIKIGTAHPNINRGDMQVFGRDLENGLARSVTVTSREIYEAIKQTLATIVHQIRLTLAKTPPELTSDICDKGIVLTGGTARLPGIAEYASHELGIKVRVADKPLECVARGLGIMMESEGELGRILRNRY